MLRKIIKIIVGLIPGIIVGGILALVTAGILIGTEVTRVNVLGSSIFVLRLIDRAHLQLRLFTRPLI